MLIPWYWFRIHNSPVVGNAASAMQPMRALEGEGNDTAWIGWSRITGTNSVSTGLLHASSLFGSSFLSTSNRHILLSLYPGLRPPPALPALTMSLTSFLIFLNAASACPNSSRTPAIFPPRLTFLVEMMILDGRAGSEAPRLRHCRCYLMQPNDRYGANNLLGSNILRYIVHIV